MKIILEYTESDNGFYSHDIILPIERESIDAAQEEYRAAFGTAAASHRHHFHAFGWEFWVKDVCGSHPTFTQLDEWFHAAAEQRGTR